MRQFLDRNSNWQQVWAKPRLTPKHTLFGFGQHYGITNCESCGKTFIRNSGIQKRCGKWNDKNSCNYKYVLEVKHQQYKVSKYSKTKSVKIIQNKTGMPSKVLTCTCGNKYIKTRDNQNECLKCLLK